MKKNLIIALTILVPFFSSAQLSWEITAGAGATFVDVESLVEEDESEGTWASDWGVFNYGVSGQVFVENDSDFAFGAEVMWQNLYWYGVSIPYSYGRIYREYSVSTTRLTSIVRYGVDDKYNVDLGLSFNFMDGLSMGLMLSSNYYFPVSENIDIPLKFRVDIIDDIVVTVPVSLNVGIRVKM